MRPDQDLSSAKSDLEQKWLLHFQHVSIKETARMYEYEIDQICFRVARVRRQHHLSHRLRLRSLRAETKLFHRLQADGSGCSRL